MFDVPVVIQGFFKDVSRMFQGYFKHISSKFQDVLSAFHWCFKKLEKGVLRVFLGFLSKFQSIYGNFKGVLSFRGVSRKCHEMAVCFIKVTRCS